MNNPTVVDALIALGFKSGWKIKEGKIVKWWAEKEQPSDEAIQEKLKELEKRYADNQYQRDRKYPDLGEQFDLLFKDIDSGKVSKDGGFYKAVKAVKDAHPKPSE